MSARALIVVDLQNDFMPDGALPVPDGYAVVPVVNALITHGGFDLVVATADWHPADHASFAAEHPGRSAYEVIDLFGLPQVLWPTHCVAGTRGAAFVDGLVEGPIEAVVRKGTDRRIDSYSGFFDNGRRKATGLEGLLRGRGVTEVSVCGLATDYCVRATAIDAASAGFVTRLMLPACRGVGLRPDDVSEAIAAMQAAGVEIVASVP